MIINKKISLKTKGLRKKNLYSKLGYDITKDTIELDISHLTKGSREIIQAECDFCNKIVNITYREYLRNINNGGKYACSMKCGSEKASLKNFEKIGVKYPMQSQQIREKSKQTNLKNIGVEYPMQSNEVKEKSKQTLSKNYGEDHSEILKKFKKTCLDNHGVEYPMQSNKIREKSKQTSLKNYGVDHPHKLPEIRNKARKTNLERYGNEFPQKLDVIKQKIKQTNIKKYGFDNPSKSQEIKNKSKITVLNKSDDEKEKSNNKRIDTNLKKYGFDNPWKSTEIREKIKQTNIQTYGSDYPMKSDQIKEKSKQTIIKNYGVDSISKNENYRKENYSISKNSNYIKYLSNGISLFRCDCGKEHDFKILSDNYYHRLECSLPLCTICYPIGDQKSIKEKEILKFIQENYFGEIISGYRNDLEIDIYLPNKKLGFEFNGLYWHSEIYKDKNYHLNKTNFFNEKGIRIVHIWEDDWIFKQEIIKSQILNFLGKSNKIYARNCEIKIINDAKITREFLNNNHIQGFVASKIKIGLYYNNELVSLMTFDQSEGRKKMNELDWNLNRFCNKIGFSIIGGASKLLNFFIKNKNPKRIISYADKSWSNGNLYKKLGFIKIYDTQADYKYIVENKRKNKQKFKKSNLGISNITEKKYMSENENFRIWDCGKLKYELKF